MATMPVMRIAVQIGGADVRPWRVRVMFAVARVLGITVTLRLDRATECAELAAFLDRLAVAFERHDAMDWDEVERKCQRAAVILRGPSHTR